jgi:hypothetical protein
MTPLCTQNFTDWYSGAPIPTPIYDPGVFTFNRTIHVFAGYRPGRESPYHAAGRVNTNTWNIDSWTIVNATTPLGERRRMVSMLSFPYPQSAGLMRSPSNWYGCVPQASKFGNWTLGQPNTIIAYGYTEVSGNLLFSADMWVIFDPFDVSPDAWERRSTSSKVTQGNVDTFQRPAIFQLTGVMGTKGTLSLSGGKPAPGFEWACHGIPSCYVSPPMFWSDLGVYSMSKCDDGTTSVAPRLMYQKYFHLATSLDVATPASTVGESQAVMFIGHDADLSPMMYAFASPSDSKGVAGYRGYPRISNPGFCQINTYLSKPPDQTYNDFVCSKCSPCPSGTYMFLNCSLTIPGTKYITGTYDTYCRACQECPYGYVESAPCTSSHDRKCAPFVLPSISTLSPSTQNLLFASTVAQSSLYLGALLVVIVLWRTKQMRLCCRCSTPMIASPDESAFTADMHIRGVLAFLELSARLFIFCMAPAFVTIASASIFVMGAIVLAGFVASGLTSLIVGVRFIDLSKSYMDKSPSKAKQVRATFDWSPGLSVKLWAMVVASLFLGPRCLNLGPALIADARLSTEAIQRISSLYGSLSLFVTAFSAMTDIPVGLGFGLLLTSYSLTPFTEQTVGLVLGGIGCLAAFVKVGVELALMVGQSSASQYVYKRVVIAQLLPIPGEDVKFNPTNAHGKQDQISLNQVRAASILSRKLQADRRRAWMNQRVPDPDAAVCTPGASTIMTTDTCMHVTDQSCDPSCASSVAVPCTPDTVVDNVLQAHANGTAESYEQPSTLYGSAEGVGTGPGTYMSLLPRIGVTATQMQVTGGIPTVNGSASTFPRAVHNQVTYDSTNSGNSFFMATAQDARGPNGSRLTHETVTRNSASQDKHWASRPSWGSSDHKTVELEEDTQLTVDATSQAPLPSAREIIVEEEEEEAAEAAVEEAYPRPFMPRTSSMAPGPRICTTSEEVQAYLDREDDDSEDEEAVSYQAARALELSLATRQRVTITVPPPARTSLLARR